MKKTALLTTIILIAGIIYLNRAYANIYNIIGSTNLPPTPSKTNYFVNEQSKPLLKIAFLGDSLTAGAGVKWTEDTYPYQLAKKLALTQKKQIEVLNLGVPGATSNDVLNNQVTPALNFAPDIFVVFIGINDLHNFVPKTELKNNLEKIIAQLSVTNKKILVINIPYLGSKKSFLPPYQYLFNFQTKNYNKIFSELVGGDWQLINLYDLTRTEFKNNENLYSIDHFHPNFEGYKLIAETIYSTLN